MAQQRIQQAYEITWLVRRLFRSLAVLADDYLADGGISAADRAVLEFLYPEQRLSVPDIARKYEVSRQHVQVTVNNLTSRGLLHDIENPNHKRSRLLQLSDLGRQRFAEIRRKESEIVERLFSNISDDSISITRDTLQDLLNKLK